MTAREKARVLEENARQLGQAARAAKDEARAAKSRVKLAKEEAKQARKAAKEAKRACAEALRASEEAAAEVAALQKRAPEARESAPPVLAKPGKRGPAPARKRVSAKRKRRAAATKPVIMKAPAEKTVAAMPVSLLGSMPVQLDAGAGELTIQVPADIAPVPSDASPGDIAPVPADVFADGPPRSGTSAPPASDING